ncbi:MAG: prealbumin-like fold domain-containing protein, partial [Thermodesulfobacteriota bacterium]
MSRYVSFAIGVFVLGFFLWSEDSSAVSTITVQKTTDPSGFDGFDFLLDGPASDSTFTLDDGESQISGSLDPGIYIVSETDLALGFELTGIICNSQDDTSTFDVDLGTGSVEITLADDDTVTCEFTNTGTVSITIEKITSPEGGVEFDFTSDIPDGDEFTLDDGESITFNVPPGTYDVQELVKAGYIVSDIVCDDMGSTTSIVTRTATIDADSGEDITCTFTNQQVVTGLNLIKT